MIYDVSMPIWNGMWSYRREWANEISTIASTNSGDNSTVYRFNICSHSGTYIETSQHKLPTDLLLRDFELSAFYRPCKVICVSGKQSRDCVAVDDVRKEAIASNLVLDKGDSLIVATGWGTRHRAPNYVPDCPFFEPELTKMLADLELHLLGVDVPVIDNQKQPYQAVNRLFEITPRLLLLAPLVVNLGSIRSGEYILSALPLNIEDTSASLCRPVLIKD